MNFAVAMGALALLIVTPTAFVVWINISARRHREKMTPGERKADDKEVATIAQEW